MGSASFVRKALSGWLAAALLAVLWSVGCGGSSGTSTLSPPPDFSISTSPSNLTLAQGGSETFSVTISALNGFSGQVSVSFSGLPTGVNVSPSAFALSAGQQQVTLTASATVSAGGYTVGVQGTSAVGTHTVQIPLSIDVPVTAAHAPVRARYYRTNSFYDPNSLQFAPPHFTVYDPAHRQFFVSNPYLNKIDVFDAIKEVQTAEIAVPFAWGIDLSPLDGSLYAATLLGDVYHIDTNTLTVITRYPSSSIGYAATEVFVLADGRLVLLGGQGGILGVDGASGAAVWDPVSNALDTGSNGSICPIQNIGAFAVSGDRTRVLAATVDEGGGGEPVCSYDAATKQLTMGAFPPVTFVRQIIPTLDGTRFFLTSNLNGVALFDARTLQVLGQITGGSTIQLPNAPCGAVLSSDGKTLFLVDQSSGAVAAYDTSSLTQIGWIPSFTIIDSQSTVVASAIDETGLIVGPTGHGVAFLDASQIFSNPPSLIVDGFSQPATGPVSGGTVIADFLSANVTDSATVGQIYVGNVPGAGPALNASSGNGAFARVTTPPSNQTGAVDLTMILSDGGVGIAPEAYSYGPTILEVVPNAATAEGGQLGAIIGYGFGQGASGLQVTIGGKSAPVTILHTNPPISPYPFPAEAFQFTIPPGTAGTAVDVTVTTASGSVTAAASFHYTAATQSYPMQGPLQSGIYDPHRDVYYFTAPTSIQVLSRSTGSWLTPISLPIVTANTQLLALSEAPDGSRLAVSDFGDQSICVLNPDAVSNIKCYAMPLENFPSSPLAPAGLAITDAGFVYFASADVDGTGTPAFHKLDTATGAVTDLGGLQSGGLADKFDHVLLSPDGSRVYSEIEGVTLWLDTTNDGIHFSPATANGSGGSPDLAVSADGSTVDIDGFLTNPFLNPETTPAYIDWETWFPLATTGQKLNSDGSVMFQPLTDGLDLIARDTGRLLYRLQVPVTVATVYDSFVVGEPGLIGMITSSGVSFVDVSSLPIPTPDSQPFPSDVGADGAIAQTDSNLPLPQTRAQRSVLLRRPQLNRAYRANPSDSSVSKNW